MSSILLPAGPSVSIATTDSAREPAAVPQYAWVSRPFDRLPGSLDPRGPRGEPMVDPTMVDTSVKFGRCLRYLPQQPAQSPPVQVGALELKTDLGSWAPLPGWARFFVDLGSVMPFPADADIRVVAAVSTPTRAYAAALCACGVVLALSSIPVAASAAEHLEILKSLPLRTTVTYRGVTVVRKAWLAGFVTQNGGEYVRLRYQGGTSLIPAEQCVRIQLSQRQLDQLPRRRMSRRIRVELGLLWAVLPPGNAGDFIRGSRLECAIVGSEVELREEIHDVRFGAVSADRRRASGLVQGHLQDVLRTRSLVGDGEGYRSDIFHASRMPHREARELMPSVVIFDGSNAFLKWRDVWPDANWVIILDRTDRRFVDAASEINRLYSTTRVQEASLPEVPQAQGMETVMFGMSRQ